MRRPAGFTTRRHRPSAAAIAYSHALTITKNTTIAESIARSALRRGAHSRLAVIAHTRFQSLEHTRRTSIEKTDGIAGPDLRSLAIQLALTRPAIERSIVDLEQRYALDRSSFARVLGLTNSRAQIRSTAITQSWRNTLDPAIMAWLGPGSCDQLAAILAQERLWPRSADVPIISSVDTTRFIPLLSTGTEGEVVDIQIKRPPAVSAVTINALLQSANTVHEHCTQCDICSERLRMLTSVRSLLAQIPLENVPNSVAESAKTAYRRIPTPLPPSVEPHRIDISRFRVPTFVFVGVIAAVGCTALITQRDGDTKPSQADRVAILLETPTPSNLLATPTIIDANTKTAALTNNGVSQLTWNATANVPWITLNPTTGILQPTQTTSLDIKTEQTTDKTPIVVTITASDGSRQTLHSK